VSVAAGLLGLSLAAAPQGTEAERAFDHGELEPLLEYGADGPRDSVLGERSFEEDYEAFKRRLREDTGFEFMVEYAPISQWGAGEWHLDHELNVIGRWTAFGREGGDSGAVLGWYQNGKTLGGLNGSEFQAALGTLSPVNGGTPFNNHDVLQHLAWEQTLGDGAWRVMAGKITSRVTFNLNRYAVSDREDFFSPMIVNNPVVTYTARGGIGAYLQRRSDAWYAAAMVRDADASNAGLDFDSLSSGNWETLAEAGLTPELEGFGEGTYRLTYGYTDAVGAQPSGWSLSVSADQDVGERLGTFARFAWADSPARDFESRLALGVQVKSPFVHPDDRWGLAYWRGEPTDPGLRTEEGLETFYRLQLAPRVELTPDLQLIRDPAFAPDRDWRAVIGLRLRVVF